MHPTGAPADIVAVTAAGAHPRADRVAVEEPLEIRVAFGPVERRSRRTLAVTLRTPGDDAALAAGFLLAEGVVREPGDLLGVRPSATPNAVRAELAPHVALNLPAQERHFAMTSACGACGRTALDALTARLEPLPPSEWTLDAATVGALPARLRAAQPAFDATGGLHAAALFTRAGELLDVREDVGRHNAMDKLFGAAFLAGRSPLSDCVALTSGRAGFELAQKCAAAGVPVLAAVGAPTSLAVELCRRFGVTLLGFVRDGRFNVYTNPQRIAECGLRIAD